MEKYEDIGENGELREEDPETSLNELLADRKYRRGRLLIIAGAVGLVISLIVLFILDHNDIVFVWGKTTYFFSYMPSCIFAFAVFIGGFICRKHCVLHLRPKCNRTFYAAISAVSALFIFAVMFLDWAMLGAGMNDVRSNIEIKAGEPIVAIEQENSTLSNTNRWIGVYRDYGWYAKKLTFILGNWDELTRDDESGEYTLYYHFIGDNGEKYHLSADFMY